MQKSIKSTLFDDAVNISNLQPNSKNFDLLFEIVQEIKRDRKTFSCRIIDQSGIANARFDKFVDKLETGGVYIMTQLQCIVIDSHLWLINTLQTSITKQSTKIEFKDKSNDISKRFYALKKQVQMVQNQKQEKITKMEENRGVINQMKRNSGLLIPISKDQNQEEIRLKNQFYKKIRNQKNSRKEHIKKQVNGYQPKIENQLTKKYKEKEDINKVKQYKQKQYKQQPQKEQLKQHKQQKQQVKQPTKQKQPNNKKPNNKKMTQHESKLKYKPKQQSNYTNFSLPKKLFYTSYTARYQEHPRKTKLAYREKQQQQPQKTTITSQQQNPNTSKQPNTQQQSIQQRKQQQQRQQQSNQNQNQNVEANRKYSGQFNPGQFMLLKDVVKHQNTHANIKVQVITQTKPQNQKQFSCIITDKSGSQYLKFITLKLSLGVWYEIDNLQILKENGQIILQETDISEARPIDEQSPPQQ